MSEERFVKQGLPVRVYNARIRVRVQVSCELISESLAKQGNSTFGKVLLATVDS